jgi:hypothetical protein
MSNTTIYNKLTVLLVVVLMLFVSFGISVNAGNLKPPYVTSPPLQPKINAGIPHAVTGYAYWPNGTKINQPIPVTITNNRTGQKGIVLVSTNPVGTYQFDLSTLSIIYQPTDTIYVNSTYTNMWAHNQTTAAGTMSLCNLRMTAFPFGPKTITASGGNITGFNGAVTLEVPAGALAADKIIYGRETAGARFGSFDSISLGPKGLVFSSPATLKWSYDGINLGLVPPETLSIYTSDNGPWEKLSSYVDAQAKEVIAQVNHFSNFSMGGAAAFGNQTGLVYAYPGTSNNPILDLTIINSDLATPDTLNYIRVFSNSTLNADITGVSIWNDLDNNGAVTGADVQIGTTRPLVIGQANFTVLSVSIPANSHIDLLIAVNVNAIAQPDNRLDLRIPVNGIGLTNAGLVAENIDPAGNTTIIAELVDPHVVYGVVKNAVGPLPFVWVNLTNNNTGITVNMVTDSLGRYDYNIGLMPDGYTNGNIIYVIANDTLGQIGWNTTVVDINIFGDRCDIYIGKGPIASDEIPVMGSVIGNIYRNITVNITPSMVPVNASTIILMVEGLNYTIADGNLSYVGNTLTFNTSKAFGNWTDGQVVNITLWQANDVGGNTCQNAPYVWWFRVSLGVVNRAPDIRIHKQGVNINITWLAITNATQYNVYRSLAINGTGFNWLTPLSTTVNTYYVDAGALSSTSNYSYVVRGTCASGEGPKSNIGWKLRRQLVENAATSDINWIALPYNSDLKFAQDLIVDLGGALNVNYVSRWVATTQSYQNKFPVVGVNWGITPGEGLLVNMKVSMIYTIVGSYNNTIMVNLLENPTTSDINWIALPYHTQLLAAQNLILNLGGGTNINYVARWVATTQSYQNKFPVVGVNWLTTPGDAILINVKVTISNYNLGPVQNP